MLPTFKINIKSTILSVTKCLLGIKFFSLVPSTEGVFVCLFNSENTSSFHEKTLARKEKEKKGTEKRRRFKSPKL